MITSVKNDKVKGWKKLHASKGRKQQEAFLIEGIHLLEEAQKSDWEIKEVILEESFEPEDWMQDYPHEILTRQVFKTISQTKSPQGIAAVVGMKEVREQEAKRVVLLDSIQDPGNLGTIIRTADAAGMDAVILGEGTVDLFNDKVVRATQGSIFHIPVYKAALPEKITDLKEAGFSIWGTALKDAVVYHDIHKPEKVALILGNEGAGITEELLDLTDERVYIPIHGKAESLNVSIAAGIFMYDLQR